VTKRRGQIRTLSLQEQRAQMWVHHPGFTCRIHHRRDGSTVLVCRGAVRPTPLSCEYRVRLEYQTRKRPHVYVEEPKIVRRSTEEKVPHTYGPDEPCLEYDDYRSDMPLALTVVPWLLLWLTFYESWLVTGVWQGGGIHLSSLAKPELPETPQGEDRHG
jgi:hypothetical protein